MNTRLILTLLISAPLLGCFGDPPDQAKLAHACQIVKCQCEQPQRMPWDAKSQKDVEWRPDGTAACPEGYMLNRAEAASIYDRPLY